MKRRKNIELLDVPEVPRRRLQQSPFRHYTKSSSRLQPLDCLHQRISRSQPAAIAHSKAPISYTYIHIYSRRRLARTCSFIKAPGAFFTAARPFPHCFARWIFPTHTRVRALIYIERRARCVLPHAERNFLIRGRCRVEGHVCERGEITCDEMR